MLWARLIPLIPAALVCLLVGPSVLRGHIPWFMDIVAQFYPIRYVAAESIHQGLIPLWNPTHHCGVPLLANPQWGTLYPINWIFFAVPNGHTFMLGYLFHHIVLASGGYWLARALFPSRLAALATALVLALGGWTWAHYPFGAYLAVVCWAPWMLGCLERHAREPRAQWIVIAGILWGLQILAGAPQALFLCSLMLGSLAVIRALTTRSLAALRLLLGSLILALLLTAAQWLPTVEFLGHTVRGGKLPLDEVRGGALDLVGQRSLLRALTGGNVFDPLQGEDAESTVFIGWLGLVLALMSLLPSPKSSGDGNAQSQSQSPHLSHWSYAVLLLLALLWSWSTLSRPLHAVMPGYGQFHDPKRALLVAHIALAVMIGGGVSWILAMKSPVSRILHSVLFALILTALSLTALIFLSPRSQLRSFGVGEPLIDSGISDLFPDVCGALSRGAESLSALGLSLILGSLMLLVAVSVLLSRNRSVPLAIWAVITASLSLLVFGHRFIDTQTCSVDRAVPPLRSGIRERLSEAGIASRLVTYDRSVGYSYDFRGRLWADWPLPNTAGAHGLLDAQGFDPAIPLRSHLFYRVLNEGRALIYPRQFCLVRSWLSPLLDIMAVRLVLGDSLMDQLYLLEGRWVTAEYLRGYHRRCENQASVIDNAELTERYEIRGGIAKNRTAQPRLVHRSSFVAVPDLGSAVRALRLLGDRVRETTVLEIPSMSPGEYRVPTAPDSHLTLHRVTETPNQMTAEIEAPAGWIVLRDQILPGWRAWIDDSEVPITPADVLFRAVEWPGGRHTLRFAFEPTSFRLGWFISLVTGAALLAITLRRRERISPRR